MRPMLVEKLTDREGKPVVQYEPAEVRKVIRDEAAEQMVEALITVVSPNGTARQAWLENYLVAGKTGTAQKPAKNRRGYEPGKYFASFIGFLPARKPELCIGCLWMNPTTATTAESWRARRLRRSPKNQPTIWASRRRCR